MALCLFLTVALLPDLGTAGYGSPPPPVVSSWRPWGEWSQCSASCGHGSRLRLRTCTDSACGGGSQLCPGDPAEAEVCKTADCAGEFLRFSRGWPPFGKMDEFPEKVQKGGGCHLQSEKNCCRFFPMSERGGGAISGQDNSVAN